MRVEVEFLAHVPLLNIDRWLVTQWEGTKLVFRKVCDSEREARELAAKLSV